MCAYVIEGDKERVQVGKENLCASERGERERVHVCKCVFRSLPVRVFVRVSVSESVCACE